MKKAWTIVLSVLCVVLLGAFIYSGVHLYSAVHEYRVAQKMYSSLSSQYVTHHDKETLGVQQTTVKNTPAPDELKEVSPIEVDFDGLKKECDDVVGWIYSPDTVIDYPVVQGEDNGYYLYRTMDGTWNGSGTIFADFRGDVAFEGQSTIIYGHHMSDGSMFASLRGYKNQEYYEEHPIMYLNTPEQNYKIELFSAFVTYADSSVYTFRFADNASFTRYVERMKGFSDFSSDVEVTVDDQILVMSTCTYEYDNARYVVFGKMVPIN